MSKKIVLVTGAGSGIGEASALAFAAASYTVVVADIDPQGATRTVETIIARGGDARFIGCDISSESDVAELVGEIVAHHGRLDAAHNNAGIGAPPGPLATIAVADWQRVVDTNLSGTFHCMRHELAVMAAAGSGAIVNTASTFGLTGVAGLSPYVATKHGIIGLTKTAALDYGASGVRINAVCPGPTDTPQLRAVRDRVEEGGDAGDPAARTALGRLAQPEEIAAAVVWLCSDAAAYVTGSTLAIDGGWLAS
jgi:NAD(P)-dependent dehydrogenase (short-subunit alcohol dehydrogenase family)